MLAPQAMTHHQPPGTRFFCKLRLLRTARAAGSPPAEARYARPAGYDSPSAAGTRFFLQTATLKNRAGRRLSRAEARCARPQAMTHHQPPGTRFFCKLRLLRAARAAGCENDYPVNECDPADRAGRSLRRRRPASRVFAGCDPPTRQVQRHRPCHLRRLAPKATSRPSRRRRLHPQPQP